jgi:hypothetical protein
MECSHVVRCDNLVSVTSWDQGSLSLLDLLGAHRNSRVFGVMILELLHEFE